MLAALSCCSSITFRMCITPSIRLCQRGHIDPHHTIGYGQVRVPNQGPKDATRRRSLAQKALHGRRGLPPQTGRLNPTLKAPLKALFLLPIRQRDQSNSRRACFKRSRLMLSASRFFSISEPIAAKSPLSAVETLNLSSDEATGIPEED